MSSRSAAAPAAEFWESRCTLPIHLHPSRLANVREGVEEQINAMLMKYVDSLGGVLISYSDLSLPSDPSRNPLQCGFIFQERSYIHFRVELKAITWRCAAGARYTGVVNAVAGDHLSVLLHGCFTATVPLTGAGAPRSWKYEAERERWVDSNKYTGEEEVGAAKVEGEEDDVSDDEGAAAAAAAAGKKLTKKELKKIERRKLRAVMLAATGRTGGAAAAASKPPPAGVVVRGSHVRFECLSVSHSDEGGYLKLTGTLVPSKASVAAAKAAGDEEPLGLTGGFTPLAPLEAAGGAQERNVHAKEEEQEETEDPAAAAQADADAHMVDFDAIASVTATPASHQRHNAAAPATAPTTGGKAPLSAKQLEKVAKKKAKLAERMAARAGAEAAEPTDAQAPPAKKQKTEASKEGKKDKKKEKLKTES